MCSMNGKQRNSQIAKSVASSVFSSEQTSADYNNYDSASLPDFFQNFLSTIENRNLGDYIEQCTKSYGGFYDLSKNKINHDYIQRCHEIVAYLTAHGNGDIESYQRVFELDLNTLFLIPDIVERIKNNEVLVVILDDMIRSGYDIYTIRSLLIRLFSIDLSSRIRRGLCLKKAASPCEMVNVITPQYGKLLDLINMFYVDNPCMDIFADSEVMYEVCNYYFMQALQSAGMQVFDYDVTMGPYLMRYVPFDVAMNAYYLDSKPIAQGSVADGGYITSMYNTIKNGMDLPNQVHYAATNLGKAAETATLCGDRILEMSDILKSFADAFMARAGDLKDKIESSTLITLVEVFIDFISDLKDLKSVPTGRWITYVSRILRCFIPNCISLAIEFVNTYVLTAITAVAQGSSEFMTTIVTALTGVIAIGAVPTTKQTNTMVEYMKAINISVPFSKNLVAMLQNIIKMLPDCIKGWFSQFVPEHFFYLKLISEYQEVLNSIDDFLNMDVDTIYFNAELQKQIARTYIASHSLVKDMAPFIGDTSGQFSLLREQLRKFDKLYESVTSLQRCGITRACPFSLTIYGTSQIGKSTLSAAVAKFMFPSFLPDKVRYVVPADPDEFWNGYSALHPVTCEDDADQDAEYKAALRFFSIVTNAPYQPPMASLDDVSVGKKGTPYHSKMHIRCTNIAWPNPTTKVLSREAYWKRRHMLVEARVKPDYMIGDKVQYDPLFKHLEFYELSPTVENDVPKYIGDVMDFFDLLKARYDRHMDNEERILQVMNATGNDFIKDLEVAFHRDFFTDAVAQGKLTDLLNQSTTMLVNRMQSTYNIVKSYLDEHPKIKRICKIVTTISALSGIVVSVFAIYSSIFGHFDNEGILMGITSGVVGYQASKFGAFAEAIPSGDMRTSRYRKFAKKTAFAEGTSDPSAESLTREVIRGRQAYIKMFDDESQKSNSMCGIFIGGRYLLAPYHLFLDCKGGVYKKHSRMNIQTDCVTYDEMFVPEKLRRLTTNNGLDKDVAVYECSIRVKLFKDIRHHFIRESDLANMNAWSEATINKYRDTITERELVNCASIVNKQYLMWNSEECMNLHKGFQYDAVTVSGDCGAVLVLYNTRIRGKILGIHVAGEKAKHHGYSELVTCEMLEKFNPRLQPAPLPTLCDDNPGIAMVEGNYTYYGVVPREVALFPVSKTEIKPSLIHGKIHAATTKPMDLHRKHFGEAISKYFDPPMPINPDIIPILVNDQIDIFKQLPRYNLGGCVSEDVAINGSCGVPYCDGMNMHTSPGLPYKLKNSGKGKHKYFGIDENNRYFVNDPLLRARLDQRLELAKLGKMCESIWVDIPKDERRKPEKKTRMIVIPPMDYTILFRRYFMDFIVNFYSNHLKFYSAVGINPYSYEWTELVNVLKSMSNFGGAGDHKFFDGKLFAEIMGAILTVVNSYYALVVKESNHEENALIREVLFEELIHTRTQCCNVLYCTHGGDPSGCPFTVILNTIANDMYFKMAWMMMAPPHLKSLKYYYENVSIYVYGDDNIKSISGNVSSWFNEVSIKEHFALYGLEYTNATKSGEMVPVEPVECLTFLKNGIRRDGMIYHATMEENTLNEMVNWIRDSDDDYAATIVNCNMALMMWYHYGRERFEEERDKILQALSAPSASRGNLAHLLDYQYLHECFTDDRMPDFPKDVTAVAQGKDDGDPSVKPSGSQQTSGESNEQNTKEETNVSGAVTFIEQKPSVIIDKDIILRDDSFLMHGEWSVKRMLARPQRIGTYSFSTGSILGSVLKKVKLPQVFGAMPANISRLLASYTFIRYRPVFRVQLNGNKFCAGRLCAVIMPWSANGADILTLPGNRRGATTLEHAFLDASSNDIVTITAPWLAPYEYTNYACVTDTVANRYQHVSTSSYYKEASTHIFYLFVFNQLAVGTGAPTSINATVWLHLEDVSLGIPVTGAATSQGGTHSYVTNNMQGWSKVANATLPTNVTGDTFDVDANLKVSTMDKPNDTMTPIYVIRRAMGYFAHCQNIEVLNRLALYPGGVSTANPSDFGTDIDEMDFKYLCGKYTLYYTTTISTTQTTGTALTYVPITPYIMPKVLAGPELTTKKPDAWNNYESTYQVPLISYISMPFNFWGGSMKFRFDFVTNSFVTAKVACAIIYGTHCPDTLTAGIEPTSSISYVFEVNADNKSFEVEVPYVAETPWKHIMKSQFIQNGDSGVSVNFDDDVAYRCCTGQVALYVLNPLSVPAGLPTSYDINVFVAGGSDFRLNYISRANTAWYPASQGNIDPNPGTDLSHLGMGIMSTDMGCMSEVYKSVKDIMKRYAHVFSTTYKVDGVGAAPERFRSQTYFIPLNTLITPFFTSRGAGLNYASNIHNWYLALYRLFRGSVRVKILFSHWTEGTEVAVQSAVSVDYIPSWTPMASNNWARLMASGCNDESTGLRTQGMDPSGQLWECVFNTTHHGPRDISDFNANFHEIEIPHVYFNRTRPVPQSDEGGIANLNMDDNPGSRAATFTNTTNDFGALAINFPNTPETYYVNARFFLAFGDDFRAGGIMPCPTIAYGGITTSPRAPTNPYYAVPPDFYA